MHEFVHDNSITNISIPFTSDHSTTLDVIILDPPPAPPMLTGLKS